jgi:hypothetical protein
MYTDACNLQYDEPMPELNVLLLEECVNFAITSDWYYTATKEELEKAGFKIESPKIVHAQGSWSSIWNGTDSRDMPKNINECKTSYCIAGYAMQVTGHVLPTITTEVSDYCVKHRGYCDSGDGRGHDFPKKTVAGISLINLDKFKSWTGESELEFTDVEDEGAYAVGATELLGLTRSEADWLFNGENELSEIIMIANEIAANRGATLSLNQTYYEWEEKNYV